MASGSFTNRQIRNGLRTGAWVKNHFTIVIYVVSIKKRLEPRINPSLLLKCTWKHIKNDNSVNNNEY